MPDVAVTADADGVRRALLADHEITTRQLESLARDFADVVAATTDVATDDEHDAEGATIAWERARTSSLVQQAQDHLADIAAALARLDRGDYATCERCGGTISPERLGARPVARTCITCASRPR